MIVERSDFDDAIRVMWEDCGNVPAPDCIIVKAETVSLFRRIARILTIRTGKIGRMSHRRRKVYLKRRGLM